MDKDGKGKVNKMSAIGKKVSSGEKRLAKARSLSESTTERTVKAGLTHEQITEDVRKAFHSSKKGDDSMSTLVANKISKKGLNQEKKQGLKEMMGKYSTKIDLNKVRDEYKNDKDRF